MKRLSLSDYQLLILFHHLMVLGGVVVYGINPIICVGVILYVLAFKWIVGEEILHLYFAHKRYVDSPKNYFFTFLVLWSGMSSPLGYSATHRLHHRYCDGPLDPHSPKHLGVFRVYFGFWNLAGFNPIQIRDYLLSDFQVFVNKHWIKLHLIIFTVAMLIDPRFAIFGISSVVSGILHVSAAVNIRGHLHGVPRNAPEVIPIQWWQWRHEEHHKGDMKNTESKNELI